MKKIFTALFLSCVIILGACAVQGKILFRPAAENAFTVEPEHLLALNDITETEDGRGNVNLPEWLLSFAYRGIEEVEKMDFFSGKYCFIVRNKGSNFDALKKWAENYSAARDFSRLAAARIEKRLISAASLYPDDEYGSFYEMLVKKAFGAEYPGAVKEDTYWIKTEDAYEFFVLVSIDIASMREIVGNMMADILVLITPTRTQRAAINRLQQIFFEGF